MTEQKTLVGQMKTFIGKPNQVTAAEDRIVSSKMSCRKPPENNRKQTNKKKWLQNE